MDVVTSQRSRLSLFVAGLLLAASTASAQVPFRSRNQLSLPRGELTGASVGSQALFAGGVALGPLGPYLTDVVDLYDIDRDRWTTANLSQARVWSVAATVGTQVLFAGGDQASGTTSSRVDIYDSSTGAWAQSSLMLPRRELGAASHGSLAFFAGGDIIFGQSNTDVIDVYDATTGAWLPPLKLSLKRAALVGAGAGDKVAFAGGTDINVSTFYSLVDIYDVPTNTWSQGNLSVPRARLVATSVGSKMLFAGGVSTNLAGQPVLHSDVDIYDTATGAWTIAQLSQARAGIVAGSVGDKAYFAGGRDAAGVSSSTVDVYDCSTGTWSQWTLSEARFAAAAATVRGHALVAGGYVPPFNTTSTVDVFDLAMGKSYCGPSVPNSSGFPARLLAVGSDVTLDNDLVLQATELPPGQFGFFLNSESAAFVPNPGGSQGNLCLGGSIGRYVRAGEVQNSGVNGAFSLVLDLTDTPVPAGSTAILAGETWKFQAWFRDSNPGVTSNFTDAVSVQFQ